MAVMARRKVATTVYLEAEQDRMLKALADRTRTPVASYIREGVDLVLAAHADELPQQLRLFDPSQLTLFGCTEPAGSARAAHRPRARAARDAQD